MAPVTGQVRIDLEEADTDHPPNTVSVSLTGPGAARIPSHEIMASITAQFKINPGEIRFIYRLEEPFKVFVTFLNEVNIEEFHTKYLNLGENVTGFVQIATRERKRLFLHWVPPHWTNATIKKVLSQYGCDPTTFDVISLSQNDKKLIICEFEEEQIPHYIEVQPSGWNLKEPIRLKCLIPGRPVACRLCGKPGHYMSKCPERHEHQYPSQTDTLTTDTRTATTTTTTTEQREPTAPASYSDALTNKKTHRKTTKQTPLPPSSGTPPCAQPPRQHNTNTKSAPWHERTVDSTLDSMGSQNSDTDPEFDGLFIDEIEETPQTPKRQKRDRRDRSSDSDEHTDITRPKLATV